MRGPLQRVVLGVMTVAVLLVHASAQADAYRGPTVVITPADRIRIQTLRDPRHPHVPMRGQLVGSMTDLNSTHVTMLLEGGQPAVVNRDVIVEFERGFTRGPRSKHVVLGALIGAAAGAAIFSAIAASDNDSDGFKFTAAELGPIGMIYGAPVGALIGAMLPAGKSWQQVRLENVEWKPQE